MKVFAFLLSGIVLWTSCSDSRAESPLAPITATSEDSIKIMKALEDESRNFYKKDFQAWSQSYVQSDKVFWACVEPSVTLRAKGWNDLAQFVTGWMKANPLPMDYEASAFKTDKVQMDIHHDMAFVSIQGSNLMEDGKTLRRTMGSRTMIKQDGNWKILSMVSYPDDSPRKSSINIYQHGEE